MAKGPDWNDVHRATPGAVCDALTEPDISFDDAPPAQPNGLEAAVAALATMPIASYELARRDEAARLGVRASILDKLVASARPEREETPGQGRPLELREPEPWEEPVDGGELLSAIEAAIAKYLVCDESEVIRIALWVVATWFEEVAEVAPILNVKSPVARCGKSTLLAILCQLVKRALSASNISGASVFRTIEKCAPTFLVDEADSFFKDNEELRGILNSGHTRASAFVIRTVGDDHEPRQFSTWGFKAIAGIGARAATIEDRSISINLRRKLPGEKVSRLRHAPKALFATLERKLCRWASDNMEAIGAARPNLPESLDDREQDNWELLLAIADRCGGEWPNKARQAALSLSGAVEDTTPLSVQLLEDMREIVAEKALGGEPTISSLALVTALVDMPERPWCEINHGKPLTQNGLARKLKPFGLKTKTLRGEGGQSKRYEISDLNDTFERYSPPSSSNPPESPISSVPTVSPNDVNDLDEKQSVPRNSLGRFENGEFINDFKADTDGTLQKAILGGVREESTKTGGDCVVMDGLDGPPDDGSYSASEAVGDTLAEQGLTAANRGHDWLRAFWSELTPYERKAAGGQDALMAWKFIAARARAGR